MPAQFKLAPQGRAALARLANAPNSIKAATGQGLADHCLAVKRGFQMSRGRGRTRGLRYTDPVPRGDRWEAVFGLRYIAAWLESGTKSHPVLPRASYRTRRDKRTGEQNVRGLTRREILSGRGARAVHTPRGWRAHAFPGPIKAGHYFERYNAKQTAAANKRISDAVMRHMSGR